MMNNYMNPEANMSQRDEMSSRVLCTNRLHSLTIISHGRREAYHLCQLA